MDPFSITANTVALVSTTSKMVKAFSTIGFSDIESRDKLFQMQDTATAINATITTIADLPTDHNEHLQNFIKDVKREMSDIVNDMAVFLEKRDSDMGYPLKRPWIRRDIDKLQKRLDMLLREVHEEVSLVYGETYLNPYENENSGGIFKKKDNSLGWLKMPWVNRDTTRSPQELKFDAFKELRAVIESKARKIPEAEVKGKKAPPSYDHSLDFDTNESLSHNSSRNVLTPEEMDTTDDGNEDVLEELMRSKKISSIEQSSDTPEAALPHDDEDRAERATGIDVDVDKSQSGLIQRRPNRASRHRHHNVLPPILIPAIRKTRVNYRTLTAIVKSCLINRVMVYVTFVALILGSTVTAGLAVWKAKVEPASTKTESPYDDNFFGNISQGLGSILGVFCMIIPLIERNRILQPDIPVWCPRTFRWLLGISISTSILSMATQCFEQAGSIMFGYVSMATQLVATMLLVIGSTEKITQRQRALDQLGTKYLVSTTLQHV